MKKFILIGCGSWGARWYRDFIPQVKDVAACVGVVDINPECVRRAGEALGLDEAHIYTDLSAALGENDIDFAVVAVGIPAHLPVVRTILACKPGCHILSEKPVAGTREECEALRDKVEQAGIKCAFTFSHRYEQDKQTLAYLLKSGTYGKINSIVGRLIVHKPPVGEADEMLLINGGVHYVDMLQVFSLSHWKSVYADIWTCPWEDGRTSHNAFLQAEMENGVHTTLELMLGSADNRNTWCNENFRIECEKACIECDGGQIHILYTDAEGGRHREEYPLLNGEHWKHDRIIREFLMWMDGGKEPDTAIGYAMEAMDFLYAAVDSYKAHQVISRGDCNGNAEV